MVDTIFESFDIIRNKFTYAYKTANMHFMVLTRTILGKIVCPKTCLDLMYVMYILC